MRPCDLVAKCLHSSVTISRNSSAHAHMHLPIFVNRDTKFRGSNFKYFEIYVGLAR